VTGPGTLPAMPIVCTWRGAFDNREVLELHAEAFETRVFDQTECDWRDLVERHSLGWVVARDGARLVGFVNVQWDGLVHAWIQDTMVAKVARQQGVATRLVGMARDFAREAGCEWLHVDFEEHLGPLYIEACGFRPTNGGLSALQEAGS
jgi:GNAT superfamily N-acetyltransferase